MFELAINLIARGDMAVDGIITHRFPLTEVARRTTPRTPAPTTASARRIERTRRPP